VAIEMVVDRSSSMAAEMSHRGRSRNRLDIVKEVFREFVEGNGETLRGRPSDLIGLVAFARYADTACPLTLSHGVLLQYLDGVKLASPRTEWDGTGIGDALALAAARLKTAEDTLARQAERDPGAYLIRSKVVILLTDGEHNCGRRTPEEAAALAKEWGIKIYVVGMVGESFLTMPGLFGPTKVAVEPGVDRRRLEALAESTGGIYREASDEESLATVYAEIDRLEKTEIETLRYVDYRERFAPLALSALALLVLEAVLSYAILRRIP
jgi:Ca-activated chloride channel family protein